MLSMKLSRLKIMIKTFQTFQCLFILYSVMINARSLYYLKLPIFKMDILRIMGLTFLLSNVIFGIYSPFKTIN